MHSTHCGVHRLIHRCRQFSKLAALAWLLAAVNATAHHGWGHYATGSPYLLNGTVVQVDYVNPHPTVTLDVAAESNIDTSQLPVPAELEALGFAAVLAAARPAPAGRWTLDLAPIARLERWGMPRAPKVGDRMQAVAFPACTESGVARPSLIVLDGIGVRQQSVRLPVGCSGRPRG